MRPGAYRRNARGLRDRQAFERVRLQAGELFPAGRSQAVVARQLFKAAREVDEQLAAVGSARERSGTTEGLAGPARDLPGDQLRPGLSVPLAA